MYFLIQLYDKLYFKSIGKSLPDSDPITFAPSFSIQSHFGQHFDTDGFQDATISSKYYTSSEF